MNWLIVISESEYQNENDNEGCVAGGGKRREEELGGSGRDESKARYRPSVFYQSVSPPWLLIFYHYCQYYYDQLLTPISWERSSSSCIKTCDLLPDRM